MSEAKRLHALFMSVQDKHSFESIASDAIEALDALEISFAEAEKRCDPAYLESLRGKLAASREYAEKMTTVARRFVESFRVVTWNTFEEGAKAMHPICVAAFNAFDAALKETSPEINHSTNPIPSGLPDQGRAATTNEDSISSGVEPSGPVGLGPDEQFSQGTQP